MGATAEIENGNKQMSKQTLTSFGRILQAVKSFLVYKDYSNENLGEFRSATEIQL